MIELTDVTKEYSVQGAVKAVVRGVSLSINRGAFVAIMGPSGAGKTTLMNLIGCLARPTRGTYLLDGVNVAALDDRELSMVRNRQIGFVFQMFHLLPRLTAIENVLLPLLYTQDYPGDAVSRGAALLKRVGLDQHIESRAAILSGGEQQRVAIARALINDPAVVLADEPTGNLDSASGAEILEVLDDLSGEGRTIVIVTHDSTVAAHARRIVTMRDGRISADEGST